MMMVMITMKETKLADSLQPASPSREFFLKAKPTTHNNQMVASKIQKSSPCSSIRQQEKNLPFFWDKLMCQGGRGLYCPLSLLGLNTCPLMKCTLED